MQMFLIKRIALNFECETKPPHKIKHAACKNGAMKLEKEKLV